MALSRLTDRVVQLFVICRALLVALAALALLLGNSPAVPATADSGGTPPLAYLQSAVGQARPMSGSGAVPLPTPPPGQAVPAVALAAFEEPLPTDPPTTTDPAGTDRTPAAGDPTTDQTQPDPAADKPDAADPGDTKTDPKDDAGKSSFSPSAAVRAFLAGLNLSVGNGPVSGTVADGVVTVKVGSPNLPVKLPAGMPALTFNGATLSYDSKDDSLTVSADASAGSVAGSLSVTVNHVTSTTSVSGADLSSTLQLNGLPVLGATVDLTGKLSYSGGSASVELTGTLKSDVVVADSFTLSAGTSVTLSTKDGLTVHGSAVVGPRDSALTVTVDGAIANAGTWSLTVATSNARAYSPVDGFTITPNVTGKIAKADGKVTFSLAGDINAKWAVNGVTFTVNRAEFSNKAPGLAVSCPEITDGQLWLDLKGSLQAPAIGLDATAEGCVNLSSKAFSVSTTVKTGLTPGIAGFTVSDATVTVSKPATGSIAVTAAATLLVTNPGHSDLTLPVQFGINADGSFVAGTSVDLKQLDLGTAGSRGTLLVATKAVTGYDASAFGLKDPVNLAAGVTVMLTYSPTPAINRALNALQLPSVSTLQASATLSTSGINLKGTASFGAGKAGAKLYKRDFAGGAAIYLNTLSLGIATNGTDVSLSIGGSAYLVLPPLYPGSKGSEIQVSLTGSIDVTASAVTVDLGFDIAANHGPWTDAFGIPDLSVNRIAGKFGVTITPADAGIPLPNVAIRVDDLSLPSAWNNALGITNGTTMSLNLALNVTNPILDVKISNPVPGAVALKPFKIVKTVVNSVPDSVVEIAQVYDAHLLFAPLGGLDAANESITPGIVLVFNANLGGYVVHVDASVALLPFPHLTANIRVPSFTLGTITLADTRLAINLDANPAQPVAKFAFSGGFTDTHTGVQFAATVDTGITTSVANAKLALRITGGVPGFIVVGGTINGSVTVDGGGVSLYASGSVNMYAAGRSLGAIDFSYNSSFGASWQQLPAAVAQAFKDAYHYADWQVAQTLQSFKFSAANVARGVGVAYNEGAAAVTTALTRAGSTFNDATAAVKGYLMLGDQQFANELQRAGYSATQIASVLKSLYGEADRQVAAVLKAAGVQTAQIIQALQTTFNEGQAAIYNTLQSIGSAGSSAIDAINGFFNTGAYNIWTYPAAFAWTLAPTGAGISTSWGNVFDHNQQWYVLPTDSGYAEIVNRGSGLCLTVNYFSTAPSATLTQFSCTGHPAQQWYLGGSSSGKNIGGLKTALVNRNSGMAADVLGQSVWAGSTVGQWYRNNSQPWNQTFTFLPAVG